MEIAFSVVVLPAPFLEAWEIVVHHIEVTPDRGTAVAAGVGPGQQVLFDGEVLEAAATFHHLDNAAFDQLVRARLVDPFAAILDGALGDVPALRPEQIGDRLQSGRFAGTVGPEEGDDAPLGYLEGYALQHQDDVIVDHLDVVDGEKGVPDFSHRFLLALWPSPFVSCSYAG